MRTVIRNERGALLAVTLIALIVLSVMGFAFLSRSNTDVKASGDVIKKTNAEYAAETALGRIALRLQSAIYKSENIHVLSIPVDTATNSEINPADIVEVTASYDPEDKDPNSSNGYWNYVYNSCMPTQDTKFDFDTREWICQRQAAMYEIRQQLQDENLDFDLELIEDSSSGYINSSKDNLEKWDTYDPTKRIEPLNNPLVANKIAQKRVYRFVVNATQKGPQSSAETLESTIVVYDIPEFQWLALSEYIISFAPGSTYQIHGWIHSNTGVRPGGYGGMEFYPSNPIDGDPAVNKADFENGDMAITTAGKIWHMFGIKEPSWYDYPANAIKIFWGENAGDNETFENHIIAPDPAKDEAYYTANPDECESTPFTSNGCWVDADPAGFTFYSMAVDADSPKFKNKIADGQSALYPGWYTTLQEAGRNPIDVIMPGNSATDDAMYKKYKKFYRSELRVIKANDDPISCELKSVNADGSDITDMANPLHISNLVDPVTPENGIVQCKLKDFYDPRKGRNANIIEVNIEKLKAMTDPPETIYVGSPYFPRGNVDYKKPAADTGVFDAVMLTHGSTLPANGLTVTSPNAVYVQGDFNLPPDISSEPSESNQPPPAAVFSDSISFLSNEWVTGNWYNSVSNPTGNKGWNPESYVADATLEPPSVSKKATYILSYMAGNANPTALEHPLIEKWSGNKLIRYISAINLWKPREFPPPKWDEATGDYIYDADGNYVRWENWHKSAYSGYYTAASWTNKQINTYGQFPELIDSFIYFSKPSIIKIKNPFL